MGDATRCVHAGEERHGRAAPLTTQIAQTSVFTLPSLGELRKYAAGKSDAFLYTRYANPTTAVAEAKIAALEEAEACLVTGSGMAAIHSTILATCRAGDEIVCMLDVYGGTTALLENVLPGLGIKNTLVPFHKLGRLESFFTARTRLLFLESPTNPTLRCADLAGLASQARAHGIVVVVDNTFATPILQKPLALGADLSLHSATKYLGGHSDLTAGAVAGSADLVGKARQMMVRTGGSLDPGAAYLLIRGLKTLELRVERGCKTAAAIVRRLQGHPKLARVMYPGLPAHEGFAAASRQMKDFGMVVSLELKGGEQAAEKFIDGLKLWYLATSLGGVESTVSYPMLSSHLNLSAQRMRWMDVTPGTVRLSVGMENAEDLLRDLEQALAKA